MKLTILLISLLFSFGVSAEELCKNYKSDIESDHQWSETDFTKENAETSLKFLQGVVSENKGYGWYQLPNAITLIRGYVLKREALKEASKDFVPPGYHREGFCLWLKSTAIVD